MSTDRHHQDGTGPLPKLPPTTTGRCAVWRWRQLAAIACISSLLAGCASLSSSDDDGDQQDTEAISEVEADPVLVRARADGDDFDTETVNAEEVFEQAYYDYQAQRYEDAADGYQILIDYFEDSRFYQPALYNGGLSYEKTEQWAKAAEAFETVIEEFPDTDEALNAHFRVSEAWYELEQYHQVQSLLTELLLRDDLDDIDRIEAHNRRGLALLELEEWTDAENSFRNALERNLRTSSSDQLDDDHRFIVMANYGVGRANHGRMSEFELVLPSEKMIEDLEEMAEYHQSAQNAYLRALREHHHYWSIAAGYKVGRLYEDFYMTIFTAEIPDELEEEKLTAYFDQLRDQIEVLMDRALRVYERNLSFSERVARGEEAEQWVDETAIRLQRMKALLEDPMVQQRAEQLVLEERDIEKVWDTTYYARRHVDEAFEEAKESIEDELPDPEEIAEF